MLLLESIFTRYSQRLVSTAVILLLLLYVSVSLAVPSDLFWDSGYGFLIWQSMLKGACFNCLGLPNEGNIAENAYPFIAAWSPGQYLVPGAFTYFGLSLDKAIDVTVALFSLVGLAGYFYVFNSVGFSRQVSAISCLVVAATRGFTVHFNTYHGGEILLFALTPWVILVAIRLRELPLLSWPLFIILFLLGIFFKLSFTIVVLAILTFLTLWRLIESKSPYKTIQISLKAAMVFLSFYSIFYALFLSKGTNPSQIKGIEPGYYPFLYSVITPVTSALSIGDMTMHVLKFSRLALVDSHYDIWWVFILLLLPAGFLLAGVIREGRLGYNALLLGFWATYFCVFSVLYMGGVGISYEERHFRPVGLIVVPGIVSLILKTQWKNGARVALLALVTCSCLYGFGSFIKRANRNNLSSIGAENLSHLTVSPAVLKEIHAIDEQADGTDIICVPSPDLALDIRRARSLIAPADIESVEVVSARRYYGKAKRLFVFLPNKLVDSGIASIFLSCFKSYTKDEWSARPIAEYTLFQAEVLYE